MMHKLLLAIAFAGGLALGLSEAARAEDLLQVYAQARAADPVLAAADAQRGVQRELAVQARAALLPQWQLGASETRDQQQGTRQGQLISSLSQSLVDLGRLRGWQAERTLESAQDLRVRAAEQALCARVATAYFGVLSAQAALATTQANEDAFGRQVAQAQSRFEAGLSAQVDVEQARAYHALARGSTLQARQALADARQALAEITGQAPGALRPLATALPALMPEPASADAWVARALQANPLLLSQARVVDAGEQRIGAARAAHWPTLSAGLDSARSSGPGFTEAERRGGTQLALRLTVPLFAGGATQSRVRQAAHERDLAQGELETTRRALMRETQAQFQAVVSGVALLESTRAAVTAADQALASTRAGQGLGTRTMTDLLLAIQTQAAAQNAHDQARHGYVLARLLLQQAAGALGEPELADVNQLLLQEGAS
jgi:outer membrane protein